jgi:superkiller protein 3
MIARLLVHLFEDQKFKGFALAVIIGLLTFYSTLTVRQNRFWNNGINFYQKMLQYSPESSRLYNNLAKAYHDAGKNDELIDLLKSSIQLQPDNALAHNNLGNAYKETGRYEEAKRSYEQAIKFDPKHAGPYFNLSTIYSDIEGKTDEAIDLLNKAVEISPQFSKSYNKLGLIYLQRGEKEKSIAMLNRALKLNPDDPEIYHNFGYIYIQMGEQQKAEAMYKKALEADPNYVEAYHDLAIIYFSAQKYDLAVKYCDASVALGYRDEKLLKAVEPYR